MASEFLSRGWSVTVLKSNYTGHPDGLNLADSRIKVIEYKPSALSRFLASSPSRSGFSECSFLRLDLLKKLLRRLFFPDHTWLLLPSIVRALGSMQAIDAYDCVVTTSFPFALHVIGLKIKKAIPKCVWIADNRDPWADNAYRKFGFWPIFLQRLVEKNLLIQADAVSFASSSALANYSKKYQLPIVMEILNGYEDLSLVEREVDASPREVVKIVHAGGLYSGSRNVDAILDASVDYYNKSGQKVVIDFYGGGPSARLQAFSHDGVEVSLLPRLDRQIVLQAQANSDFILIAMSKDPYDKTYVPAKLFEAVAIGRPVIALCWPDSDLAKIVCEYSLGVASFDASSVYSFMVRVLSGEWTPPGAADVMELSARRQFNKMIDFAETVVQQLSAL